MQEDHYNEERPAHYYRTELPNCLIEAGLEVYQLAVYIYIKKIAGDGGRCFQTEKNMAKAIGISERKFRIARDAICSCNNKFKYPLLKKTTRKKPDGSCDSNVYTVIDIWAFNLLLYSTQKSHGTAQYAGGVGHNMPGGGAQYADKEEPLQEEPIKNGLAEIGLAEQIEKETIHYTNRRGQLQSITRSEIHRHFLGKPYTPKQVDEAIKKFEERKGAVTDALKLLELMIGDIKKTKTMNTQPLATLPKSTAPAVSKEKLLKMFGIKEPK